MEYVGVAQMESGERATIYRSGCPLPPEVGPRLTWFLEGVFGADEKPDLFVTAAAKGMYEEVARHAFGWAERDGAIVSAAWTMTPHDDPRIGTLGEVYTDPAWRGRGMAGRVCQALLDRFDDAGGRVIFLASENPVARRIYDRLGFLSFPRGLMRRERPPDEMFDEQWFRPGQLSIRLVHPGDTPRLVALYSAPSQWLSVASPQGLYSAGRVTHDRCNSLVKHTWVATRAGAWFAMANAEGALVGSGPMEPRGNEREPLGAEIDIFVHPAFVDHAGLLLARMVQEGSERGWRWLIAQLGDDDTQKRELLEATGFREVVRLADALSFGGTRQGLRILRMELGGG